MKIEFVGKCLLISEEGKDSRKSRKGGRDKRNGGGNEKSGKRVLVVGDLHLGYEESLNLSGVFIGRKMFGEMINYFDRVFAHVGEIDAIVLLGDVKHDFGGILKQEWNDVLGLFDYFFGKMEKRGEIVIVKGNHDKILEPIVKKRKGVRVEDYFIFGEICFVHGDRKFEEMNARGIEVWVMGHGHPAVKISDGVKVEKYKCFLDGRYGHRRVIIVPSFFELNAGSDPRENSLGLAWDFELERFNVRVVEDEDLNVRWFGGLGEMG